MQNWLFDIRSRSFVLLTALFLILTALVFSEVTDDFDQSIILYFSENIGNPTLDIVMQYVTESGDVFNMMIFAIIVLLIPKTRRVG
ncbi:MAG: phosphatase PAP2 family protein, partial [Nitrosopumilus sp.]|nr:phosphatase PAP2 family protein [Nitrosopumilus sp.]